MNYLMYTSILFVYNRYFKSYINGYNIARRLKQTSEFVELHAWYRLGFQPCEQPLAKRRRRLGPVR